MKTLNPATTSCWKILQAAIDDLMDAGMKDATSILYTGKGGGGVAALFTVDRIVAQIEEGLTDPESCDIRSFTDSGWVSAHDPYTPRECDDTDDSATCNIAGGVERGVLAWHPEYPQGCHDAGYTWECYFANYSFEYIETDSFVYTYEYDFAQLDTDGLVSFHGGFNDLEGIEWANEQAENLVEKEMLPHGLKYAFLPGCWDHEIMDKDVLQDIYIGDKNLVDAMAEWYAGADELLYYDDSYIMNDNPSCLYA